MHLPMVKMQLQMVKLHSKIVKTHVGMVQNAFRVRSCYRCCFFLFGTFCVVLYGDFPDTAPKSRKALQDTTSYSQFFDGGFSALRPRVMGARSHAVDSRTRAGDRSGRSIYLLSAGVRSGSIYFGLNFHSRNTVPLIKAQDLKSDIDLRRGFERVPCGRGRPLPWVAVWAVCRETPTPKS